MVASTFFKTFSNYIVHICNRCNPIQYPHPSHNSHSSSSKLLAVIPEKMAAGHLAFFISSLLLLPLTFFPFIAASGYGDTPQQQKKNEVAVEGKVYCQSCDSFGSWSLLKAEPIASAKVGVICKNNRDQVSFYKAFETDKDGYFFAHLDGFKMSHLLSEHPLLSCHVRLVSSPLDSCNLLTNVNSALYGSPLRYEKKRLHRKNYEVMVFAAGPLAFRPAHCPAPTHY